MRPWCMGLLETVVELLAPLHMRENVLRPRDPDSLTA